MIIISVTFTLNGQIKSPVLSGKDKVAMLTKQTDMKVLSPFKDLKWQYVGPTNISGRCTDVEAVTPHGKSYTIWVGSATGGVWKSVNEGTTFEPVLDDMPTASTGDIAIDPNNSDVVWVGTGEANIFRSSNAGCGIFKTTDGGKTFKSLRGPHVDHHGLWIDPANPDHLLNVQDGGLAISYDRGKNWKKPIEELPLAQFYNVAYDFSTPFRVFGSIQDHHSFYGPVDLSRGRDRVPTTGFKNILGAEGSTHAINPKDNNTIYSSTFYGALARAEINNYPATTKDLLPNSLPGEEPLRGEWVAAG